MLIIWPSQGRPSRECQRALAPLVFWSRCLKKSQKVSKSKSRSKKWHQLFLPSLGADDYVNTYLCNWFILSACFKCCLIFVLVWLNLFLINKSSRSIFWLWNLFGNVDVVLFWRLLCKVSFTSVESSSSFLNKKVLSESWEFSTKSWIASLMSKGCRSKLPKKYKLKNEDFLSWNKK